MSEISKDTRLKEVFNYRDWYQHDDDNNYMVFINGGERAIEAGEQLFFSYGFRSNSYLLNK
jgi:hypothetical protein